MPLTDVVSVALAQHIRSFGKATVTLPWREPGAEERSAELLFTNRDRARACLTHNAWKPGLRAAGLERNRENGMHALRRHYAGCSSRTGSASKRCPNTWATTIPASPCAPAPI